MNAFAAMLMVWSQVSDDGVKEIIVDPINRPRATGEFLCQLGLSPFLAEEYLSLIDPHSSTRILTPLEQANLRRWSEQVIDKSLDKSGPIYVDRRNVIEHLKELRHIGALPALLAVSRDNLEDSIVRHDALDAMRSTASPIVIESYIDLLGDEIVGDACLELLYQMTDLKVTIGINDPRMEIGKAERRQQVQWEWRCLWEQHPEKFTFSGKYQGAFN